MRGGSYEGKLKERERREERGREIAYGTEVLCGNGIQGYKAKKSLLQIGVKSRELYSLLLIGKNQIFLQGSYLLDIAALDDPQRGGKRFEVNYVLGEMQGASSLQFKVQGGSSLVLTSLASLYPSANGLEREVWDLYGIKFLFHPNLRRILTDYGFRGYPLRKDFPLMGFVELRYDDLYQAVLVEPVELSQSLRFFAFQRPGRGEESSSYAGFY